MPTCATFSAADGNTVGFHPGELWTAALAEEMLVEVAFQSEAMARSEVVRYLGADATQPRFRPTKFRRADAVAKLEDIAARPGANDKSRVSVLLANAEEKAEKVEKSTEPGEGTEGAEKTEAVAATVAPGMTLLARISAPLVWLLDLSGKAILRLLGGRQSGESSVTRISARPNSR